MCILQKTWQVVDNTSALYEVLCRLGTDKFMVDGRHTELVAETVTLGLKSEDSPY
jgi:uncharacterized protein (DUF2126 family)